MGLHSEPGHTYPLSSAKKTPLSPIGVAVREHQTGEMRQPTPMASSTDFTEGCVRPQREWANLLLSQVNEGNSLRYRKKSTCSIQVD